MRLVSRSFPWLRSTVAAVSLGTLFLAGPVAQEVLESEDRRWVEDTLAGMTLDEKVGQLILPSFRSVYTSSDSEAYDALVTLVHEQYVGGVHLFGARQAAPDVLLNPTYARTGLGQPLAAASLINRPPGHRADAAPRHGRFRDWRRVPDRRRHDLSAGDGVRGGRGSAART